MAAVLILEPIFEADLAAEQHAYRAKHSAQEAEKEVHGWLKKGLREVVDADLSGYFDTIPHDQLMKKLRDPLCEQGPGSLRGNEADDGEARIESQ